MEVPGPARAWKRKRVRHGEQPKAVVSCREPKANSALQGSWQGLRVAA